MSNVKTNARRMVQLFAQMREERPGPAFVRLKDLNLSLSHMRTLRLLAHEDTLSMKDLADQLQITPPSVTALSRRLVQTGLVQRSAHAEDSRVVLIALTAEGRTLHEQLTQEHIERMEQLLQGLTEQEQEQFLDLLERAIQALRGSTPQQDSTSDAVADEPAADNVSVQ